MIDSGTRPPRLYVFAWFCAAVGVLVGAFVLQSMGWSEAMGLQEDTAKMVGYVLCAYMLGQGVGEWRGLLYAKGVDDATQHTS